MGITTFISVDSFASTGKAAPTPIYFAIVLSDILNAYVSSILTTSCQNTAALIAPQGSLVLIAVFVLSFEGISIVSSVLHLLNVFCRILVTPLPIFT